ncbi:MAG: nucleotide exchange factor GrpE [Thermoanaerobaculia bacterium]|nr:nucleotide exchange factor GrpE [Thermoanaerobaculia bacterium]
MKNKRPDSTKEAVMDNNTENTENTPEQERLAELEAKVETLTQQLDESRNKYLYLFSDFENFKRNAAKERIELQQTAGRDIVTALLPVLDDFDRAAKNGALNEGMALIHQKITNTLQNKGLTLLEVKAGDDFNPDTQEAVAEIPAASEELKGKIVDIVEQGYQLGDRIIRFAKVVIGR